MTYSEIINSILDSYLEFVSDKYYSLKDNTMKEGKNKYNELALKKDCLIINEFTSGRFTNLNTSFLFVGVSSSNSTQGQYIGDSSSYKNTINLVVRVYKQTKQADMFIAYNAIPILLNTVSREYLAEKINNSSNFTITNISMSNAEPTFDFNNTHSVNDFSSIRGVFVELNINFDFYSNEEEKDEFL